MKIMSHWIRELLESQYTIQVYGLESRIEIQQILLYEHDMTLKEKSVYVCDSASLVNLYFTHKKSFFVCTGERPPQRFCAEPFSMVWVQDAAFITVFNTISEYMSKLRMWENAICQIESTTQDIKQIITLSIPVFDNEIAVMDESFNFRFRSVEQLDSNGEFAGFKVEENMLASLETIATSTLQHIQNHNLSEPHSFKNIDGTLTWVQNILEGDTFKGCITLNPSRHPLTSVDKELFRYLTDILIPILRYNVFGMEKYSDNLEQIYKQILSGEPISEFSYQQIEAFQKKERKQLPISSNNIICLKLESIDSSQYTPMAYYRDVIKQLFPSCVSLFYEHCVVNYISIGDSETAIPTIVEKVTFYLQDSNVRAGISMPFADIKKARYYYYQARIALNLGNTFMQQQYVYTFRESALCHILLHGSNVLPAQFICPSGLWKIWQERDKGPVDYWETIKVYMEKECNASQTARQLCVHRQTFLYRIEKLKEWLDVDFDNANDRLWLQISIKLFELESAIL